MFQRFSKAIWLFCIPLYACSAASTGAPNEGDPSVSASGEATLQSQDALRIPPLPPIDISRLGMSAANYEKMFNDTAGDCTVKVYPAECDAENDYAMSRLALSAEAARLGKSEGMYPLLDQNDRIVAVCGCAHNPANPRGSTEPVVTPPPPRPTPPPPRPPPSRPECRTGQRCCEPAPGGGCNLCVSGNQACP